MAEITVDKLTEAYIKLRDKKAEISAEYKAKLDEIENKKEKIEAHLLKLMEQTGTSQLGSPHGTAYREVKLRASGQDWAVTYEWIKENDRFDLLEKRISSSVVKAVMEETGEPPPGINIFQEYTLVIRRK